MNLADQLRILPDLAQRAGEQAIAASYGGSDGSGIRTAPTSKPPAGVNLDRIDLDRGRQHPALLAKLGQCIRVVCEEVPAAHADGPELAPEGAETWAGECTWLLATMHLWKADEWTWQWVLTEVSRIHRKLTEKLDRHRHDDGMRKCSICGNPITSWTSRTITVAECAPCQRVIGMRELPGHQKAANEAKLNGARRLLGLIARDGA